ncbi:MAG: hypothetical protein HC781_08195 [Leptolyngbyaceae cyanobacterium CSU_1_4]|nr:hypothetical protein [Leptolyngbyaceae cyanobacterium CSU_1_4]
MQQLRATDEPDDIVISVISNRLDFDPRLPIDHLQFSAPEFEDWTRSPHGIYNHRVKIHALIKALDHYQAPVALIDTDTYFTASPTRLFERISPQKTVMHLMEFAHIIDHPLWQPMIEKIGEGLEISGVKVSPQSSMFNSGVIGVEPSHRELLERSLAVVDDLYGRSPIFNVEQFGVGVTLNQATQLVTSEDLIEHYYGFARRFVHLQTARLFPDFSADTLEKLLASSSPLAVGYPPKALSDRIITRVLTEIKRWSPEYKFAHICYRTAFFYASKNREYANIWAAIALQWCNPLKDKMTSV